MKDDRADHLDTERFHTKRPFRAFSDCRISLGKNVVKCLPFRQSGFKFVCLISELFIAQFLHLRPQLFHFSDKRFDPAQLALAVCAE